MTSRRFADSRFLPDELLGSPGTSPLLSQVDNKKRGGKTRPSWLEGGRTHRLV